MTIVTDAVGLPSGTPLLAAKPGGDDTVDTFAGLLAALSGLVGSPVQAWEPDAANPAGANPASQSASPAGTPSDPYGLLPDGLVVTTAPAPAAGPDAVAGDQPGPVATGSVPSSVAPVTSAGPPAIPASASMTADAATDAPPVAVITDTAAGAAMSASSQVSGPVVGSTVPPPVAPAGTTAASMAAGPATVVADTTPAPKAAVPASGTGQAPAYPSPAAVPTPVSTAPSEAASQIDSSVTAGAAPNGVPAASPGGPGSSGGSTGYQEFQAVQAALVPPAHDPVQVRVAPEGEPTAPSAISPPAQGAGVAAAGTAPQFTPDGGSGPGDGKQNDPGQTPVMNPQAASPAPVFQNPVSTPVVTPAALPHQVAQNILDHLNQGGSLPAQLQLQLDPPALGKLTVHLALVSGTLSVTFVTASSHARDAVAASLPQMRELLGQNNVVVGHTGVYLGSSAGGNTGGDARGTPRPEPRSFPAQPAAAGEEGNQSRSPSGSSLVNILV